MTRPADRSRLAEATDGGADVVGAPDRHALAHVAGDVGEGQAPLVDRVASIALERSTSELRSVITRQLAFEPLMRTSEPRTFGPFGEPYS